MKKISSADEKYFVHSPFSVRPRSSSDKGTSPSSAKMSIKSLIHKTFVIILTAMFPAAAQAQSGIAEMSEPLSVETDGERAQALFLDGLCQQLAGHYSEAYDLFSHALALNPRHVGALYELSNYARHLGNDSLSLLQLEQAARLDADNFWLKQALVNLYVSQHRTDDAIRQLEQMSKQYPQRSDLLMMLADMYQRGENYEALVRTIDRIEVLEGKSEQLSMQKFHVFLQMKDEQRAFAEMQALAAEYPNDVRYQVIIGDLYHDRGDQQRARQIYDRLLADHPDNVNLQLSYFNYYHDQGLDAQADSALQQLLVNPQVDANLRHQFVGALAYDNIQQNGDTTSMMQLFRQLLAQPQEDTRIVELAARYMVTRDMPTAQIKPVLHQMLAIDPEAELARNQLLSYAIEEEDTAAIVHLCKTAVDYGTNDPVYYYYLAIGYFQQNKNRDAIDAAKRGLTRTDDKSNLALVTNLYAILGDLYHRTGQDELAFQAYDSCLIYRPDDALVLNNYAYYLSLRKQDLQRAEQMSRRSLQHEGTNPTYLDTYAWILFQQHRYEEARTYIDSVLVILGDSAQPDDVSLLEHAGDIYARCGLTDQAVRHWQKALELGGPNALIEKKIRKRKYYEK